MNKCTFVYWPAFTFLYGCETKEQALNEDFELIGESYVNSQGTFEYEIFDKDKSIFKYEIPLNHPEEEDLDLSEWEGKIIVREINVYSEQSIEAFYDMDEGNFEPGSVFMGLAVNFGGILFGEDEESELEEYYPENDESEERFFKYYKITNGIPVELEYWY